MAVGPRRQVPSKGVLAGCACAPAGAALCGGVGFLRVSRTRLACWTDVPPGPRLPFCPFLKLLEGGARHPRGRAWTMKLTQSSYPAVPSRSQARVWRLRLLVMGLYPWVSSVGGRGDGQATIAL